MWPEAAQRCAAVYQNENVPHKANELQATVLHTLHRRRSRRWNCRTDERVARARDERRSGGTSDQGRAAGRSCHRKASQTPGARSPGGDWVPHVPVSVMILGRRMLEGVLEEALKDLTVLGVFIEQPHVLSVEGIVLLDDDVNDLLELLVVLSRHADPAHGEPSREKSAAVLSASKNETVGGYKKEIEIPEGKTARTEWRHSKLEWRFGGLGNEVVADLLDQASP
ncbi:hypothetical protein B0H14DRAFT_2600758 [Mycena olivaceomarginata]|nr:hypothetical protein B0H14DRAFT_2600758 [Mycena olivaceomarginata]